jgi:hypothetical protein
MTIPLRQSVNGLHPTFVNSEVFETVFKMIPDWSFEVRGDHSSTIQIHLERDGHNKTKSVHPSDYVNDPDPWARTHPTVAAVTEGIQSIMRDLALGI